MAKNRNLDNKLLFNKLQELGFIKIKDEERVITPLGEKAGAEYKNHKVYGKYIVWPENIELSKIENEIDFLQNSFSTKHKSTIKIN